MLASLGIADEKEDDDIGGEEDDIEGNEDVHWISDEDDHSEEDEKNELPEIESGDSEDELAAEEQQLFLSKITSIDDRCRAFIQKKRNYIKRKSCVDEKGNSTKYRQKVGRDSAHFPGCGCGDFVCDSSCNVVPPSREVGYMSLSEVESMTSSRQCPGYPGPGLQLIHVLVY